MLLFSDSCAVSTRNDFLSIDFRLELDMSGSTVYLRSYREYHRSNLGFHTIKDHTITNKYNFEAQPCWLFYTWFLKKEKTRKRWWFYLIPSAASHIDHWSLKGGKNANQVGILWCFSEGVLQNTFKHGMIFLKCFFNGFNVIIFLS